LTNSKISYSELELIDQSVFQPCGLALTNVEAESESQEYFAHSFQLEGHNIKFRTAKITPTKTGQFVAIWKRNEKGITAPFDTSDDFGFFIIATRKDFQFGIFIFPKTILHEHGILSDKAKGGTRGIRVYPPWDLTTNKQAQKTQHWQTNYFLEISKGQQIDPERAKKLLNLDIEPKIN
jgi:hypothetical protein